MLLDAPAPPPCGNSASSVTATITPRTTAAPTPSPTANSALRCGCTRGAGKEQEMVLAAAWVILRGWEGRAAPCRPAAVRGWPGSPDAPAAHRGPVCGDARLGDEVGGEKPCWTHP